MKLTRQIIQQLMDAYYNYPDINEFDVQELKFENGRTAIAISYASRLPAPALRPVNNSVH